MTAPATVTVIDNGNIAVAVEAASPIAVSYGDAEMLIAARVVAREAGEAAAIAHFSEHEADAAAAAASAVTAHESAQYPHTQYATPADAATAAASAVTAHESAQNPHSQYATPAGGSVTIATTPTNYTPAAANATGHFEGIDTALGTKLPSTAFSGFTTIAVVPEMPADPDPNTLYFLTTLPLG